MHTKWGEGRAKGTKQMGVGIYEIKKARFCLFISRVAETLAGARGGSKEKHV